MLLEGDPSIAVRFRAIICDFGLVAVINKRLLGVEAFVLPQIKGASIPYAAPERFLGIDEVSPEALKACDIYSVAVVYYELLTRSVAWRNMRDAENLKIAVMSGKRPELTEVLMHCVELDNEGGFYRTTVDLLRLGWHPESRMRPSIAQIEAALYEIKIE
jgi:serine/threonine protein kinase